MSKPTAHTQLPIMNPQGTDEEMLDALQRETFEYFLKEVNTKNGLVADKTDPDSHASIAAVGMGLTVYIAGVERKFITREQGVENVLRTLNFLHNSHQGPEPDATGYKGFYYHFLDMETGKRAWESELSTIDTAIFIAGVLAVANYFTKEDAAEKEIRKLADKLYSRVDWQWARNGEATITHGWKPETGFLPYRWNMGYSEAHILYFLALGSPTFPIDVAGYKEWSSTFEWKDIYNTEYIYAGPLFIHQMSHLWLDFRGIEDDLNRKVGIDYFENSSRATCVQQKYAIENPLGYEHYGQYGWGFTASDGPGPVTLLVDGVQRQFYNYTARGIPYGPDDGTISPWAVVASLPFASEVVLHTVRHAIERLDLKRHSDYGFDASFNPTFPEKDHNRNGWVSPWQYALNQGPIVIMIENFQTGLIWDVIRKCPYVIKGLQAAGFSGGWLDKIK